MNWPGLFGRGDAVGPERIRLACTRSALSADRLRANTDSVMRGKGTPRSRALWLVHLPVPFCPA